MLRITDGTDRMMKEEEKPQGEVKAWSLQNQERRRKRKSKRELVGNYED